MNVPTSRLKETGLFYDIDLHFAQFLLDMEPGETPELLLGAALVSRARSDGHVCIDLKNLPGYYSQTLAEYDIRLPDWENWREQLKNVQAVGHPGQTKPLILVGSRLYLNRYWQYENDLAQKILNLAEGWLPVPHQKRFANGLNSFFEDRTDDHVNWQKVAAFMAVTRRLCVISGGPGTGKTTTLARILALLLQQDPDLDIALAAPTGKAAARMNEAIRQAKKDLDVNSGILDLIPEDQAKTIHRLLGFRRYSPYFRHDSRHPLRQNLVVVDEASMVDLALMAKLVRALKEQSRLILLGDKDQLASVEAGAFLGDVCRSGEENRFSERFCSVFQNAAGESSLLERHMSSVVEHSPLQDCLVQLKKSWRFGQDSGIEALCRVVNAGGTADETESIFTEFSDITWTKPPSPDQLKAEIKEKVLRGFTPYIHARSPRDALLCLGRFRILCALRDGPYGVLQINRLVEEILKDAGLIQPVSQWYINRPVMITRNDYSLGLFNGDIGVVWQNQEEPRRVFFPSTAGNEARRFIPALLPQSETVYAMTVHKSQGSEFDHVLLILPDQESPVLTRELIYTGITRARKSMEIVADRAVFQAAIATTAIRSSGLGQALWGGQC